VVYLSSKDEVRRYYDQYKYCYIFIVLFLLIIISRLWYLQIYKGELFKLYADQNRVWQDNEIAPRGLILDREGKLLVDNKLSFDVIIRPQYLQNKNEALNQIARLLNISKGDITLKLSKAKNLPPFYPVAILEDVNRDIVAVVEANKLFIPGIDILTKNKRTYLMGKKLAHAVGYIGEVNRDEINSLNLVYEKQNKKLKLGSQIGKFGIEKVWDENLRGIDGTKYVIVDANGRMKDSSDDKNIFGNLKNIESIPGKNISLTIDADLQNKAYESFEQKNRKGAIIAIHAKTGEILVMLSSPSFDPTTMSKGITPIEMRRIVNNPFRPFYNKTIQDHYSPGSVYKPLVAIAGLEEGVDNDFNVSCRGKIRFGKRDFHCHSKRGHGTVGFHESIVKSCDIFYYRLGSRLGVDLIYKHAVDFGLNAITGVDLPGEIPGLIPSSDWKRRRFNEPWFPGEDLSLAIGQSYNLTTPIQLANLYAGIATGVIYKPRIIKTVNKYDGSIIYSTDPEVLIKPQLKEGTKKIILDSLYGVVNEAGGTAWWSRVKGLDIAGKTGTVQLYKIAAENIYNKCEEMEETLRHHGVFVGFAPVQDPEIVVAVVAEHACSGSGGAAPIARDIIKEYYNKYGFERDRKIKEEGI